MIDWYNHSLNTNIIKLGLDTSNILSNAWLAGIADCDSNFQISLGTNVVNNVSYPLVKVTWELFQSRIDPTHLEAYKPIMAIIAAAILTRVEKRKQVSFDRLVSYFGWRVRNVNKAGSIIIANYFKEFPLFTSKHLDCLDWCLAQSIYVSNGHWGKPGNPGLLKLASIKSRMNDSRKIFTWVHPTSGGVSRAQLDKNKFYKGK